MSVCSLAPFGVLVSWGAGVLGSWGPRVEAKWSEMWWTVVDLSNGGGNRTEDAQVAGRLPKKG